MRLIAYWLQRGLINCCWNSLFAFTFASSLFAQSFKLPPPEVITDRQGLPQAFVSAIVQDQKGFVWLATLDGLCRYDGRSFRVFQPISDRRPALSSSEVTNVVADHRGRLWVSSDRQDIDLLDPDTERFINFSKQSFFQRHFGRDTLESYYPDRRDRLWLIYRQRGLVCLDLRTQRFRRYLHQPNNPNSLSSNTVRALLQDKQGAMWMATDAGLDRLDERTGRFTHYRHEPGNETSIPDNNLRRLYQQPSGSILVWSADAMTELNPQSGYQRTVALPHEDRWWPHHHAVSDSQGNTYFDQGDQLFRYNEQEGVQLLASLSEVRRAQSLYIDRSDVLWVGTDGAGIRKYSLRTSGFKTQPYQSNFYTDLLTRYVGVSPNQVPPGYSKTSLYWVYYFRSTLDSSGRLWFNVGSDPVSRFDFQTKQLTSIPFPVPIQTNLNNQSAPMATDPQGRVWVVYDSLVLWYEREQWHQFSPIRPIVKSNILHIVVDEQALWLATQWNGLYRVDRRNGQIRHYAHQPQNPTSLSNDKLLSVFADPVDPNKLWIGTHGGGLCHFDKRTGHCRRFNKQNGLPNNVVYAAIPDNQADVWVATNQGLCRLDRRTFQTRIYTHEDGLLADEFNRFHFLHLSDDRVMLGGLEGITSFYPSQLQNDPYQPPVELTEIRVNNQPIQPALIDSLPAQVVSQLDLPYNQNFLTVGFAALQYNNLSKLRYRYQLEGIDADWIVTDRPEAIYTNLSPGHYALKVNASNTSGIWSSRVRTLLVTIHPPFWATWWAYLLYTVILGAVAYGLFRTYINRLHLRQQVSLKQQEAQQLKAVDEIKTRFFSNITHEFRTPLTLILTPAEQLKQHIHEPEQLPQNRRRLETIDRNAHQLIGLVNQLLDLSKLEANALPITEVQGNLVSFIGQLVASFEAQAEAKSIHLVFAPADGPSDYWFDADKLERIVTNLVANALKFTAEGGTVTVVLTTSGDRIQLSVTDTGIGIPVDKLAHIFDRFYQVDDSSTRQQEGTGIGLALVKELVDLQSGQIGVTSQPGEGSTFAVQLPYRRATASLSVTQSDGGQPSEDRPIQESRPNGQEKHRSDAPVVLLVEDNAELAHFIAGSLPTTYQLIKAANGAEGWQQAIDQMPDLVISDVLMPVMDGYTLCRKLKEDVRTSHIPVMMLTAKSAYESRLEGLSLGADDYIAKPFHVPELQLRVRNLLEQRRQYREWLKAQLANPDAPTNGPEVQAPDPFLDRLNTLLESHLSDQTFGVDQLAQELAMSRMNLHRKLKAVVNLAPGEVIRMYRLKRATQFLRQGLRSAETAYQVGFDSPSYFSKSFRDEYGLSPSEYVEAEQKKASNS